MRLRPLVATIAGLALTATISARSGGASDASESTDPSQSSNETITVKDAFGEVEVPAHPERVATVNWANQEVPLALGVVPVGMAATNFGDEDGSGVLPWVREKLDELDAPTPTLFDETDGIDFEAVAATKPDVILAAYSGLTQEDYDTLSAIAPVVAYPEVPWKTDWRQMILLNSKGMGEETAGKELVASLEEEIATKAAEHPELKDKSIMFLTHIDPTDLSQVSFYTGHDTRAKFFEDLGMKPSKAVAEETAKNGQFSATVSAERADTLDDVDIIVTYCGDDLVKQLEDDPILSKIPAVKNGAIVNLPGDKPFGTAANPTPLSISWVLDDYLEALSQAAGRGENS